MDQELNKKFNQTADRVAGILIRCFLIGAGILLAWFGWFLTVGEVGYQFHSKWIGFSKVHFDLINYCGMAVFKLMLFTFFLIPYISIRLVLRNALKKDA